MDINKFIDSISNELFNRIRNSKSDAEARRLLKEHQALQLLQPDVSISLERAKKYARHQYYVGTQQREFVEWENWAKD